jgi:glucose/arabinose dehydrogenase
MRMAPCLRGWLSTGPDGMLWATTGEHAEPGISQDRESLGGMIVRMTPDGRPMSPRASAVRMNSKPKPRQDSS